MIPRSEIIPDAINQVVEFCHAQSRDSGWWTDPQTGEAIDPKSVFAQKLALMHSELSEALEADRKDLMDDKLTHRHGTEVEFADAVIRIFDMAGAMGMDLGGAISEKLDFNAKRADHKIENRKEKNGKKY